MLASAWRLAAVVLAVAAIARVGAADRIAYQGRLVVGTRGIVVMDASGDNPVELPHPPGSDVITPALSPDGKTLAYAAKAGDSYKLWTVPLADDNSSAGEPRQLTTGAANDEQPAWSPDGRRIAYVSSTGDERALMVAPADAGDPRQVTLLGSDFRNACPHWSPDGASIVFSSEGKLFIVGADSGDKHELVADGMYPSWSPDGREIAFFARKPEPALTIISPDTGQTRRLVEKVDFFGETAWSPDGKHVAFKADKVGAADGQLWVVPAAGGQAKPVRSYGIAHGYLDWSRGPVTVAAAPPSAPEAAQPAPPSPATKPPTTGQVAPTRPAASAPKPTPPRPPAVAEPPKRPEAPPQPAPVRVISPADGATVRGLTKVIATKLEPSGYMIFFVDGKFVRATIAPYELNWDTALSGDGPHTISVIGYGATGAMQGSTEVRVEVRNTISEATLPQEGVLLRYRFKPKAKWSYSVSVQAQAGAKGETPLPAVAEQGGSLRAVVTQQVEDVKERPASSSPAEQAVATILTTITEDTINAPGADGALPQAGQTARSSCTTDGEVTPLPGPGAAPIALGNLCLQFPPEPVKVGDKWTAPMTVLPVLRSTAVARVTAQHQVESVQWEQGYETMRIVSTFKVSALPVGVQGMSLRDVSCTRVTSFAHKEHFVVRMEDRITGVFRQEEAAPAAAQAPPHPGATSPEVARSSRGQATARPFAAPALAPVAAARPQGLSPNGDRPLPGGLGARHALPVQRGSAFPLGWQRLPQRDRDSPRPALPFTLRMAPALVARSQATATAAEGLAVAHSLEQFAMPAAVRPAALSSPGPVADPARPISGARSADRADSSRLQEKSRPIQVQAAAPSAVLHYTLELVAVRRK